MSVPQLTNSTKQMTLVMLSFLATIFLLESGGLVVWAQRLEIGSLRSFAEPITQKAHDHVSVLGIAYWRNTLLTSLANIGWSDSPVVDSPTKTSPTTTSAVTRCPPPAVQAVTTATPLAPKTPKSLTPSDVPVLTPLPSLLPHITANTPRQIGLVGDSMMAVGLSSTLLRKAAKRPDLHIIKAFRSGTGLARPDAFNWLAEYPAMLGTHQPDVVIVAIGANDAQGFVENGKVLAYGTEKWIQVYHQRVTDFMNMISANGQYVLWVGMPPMKQSFFNTKMALINRITYSVVSQYPQATWWNPVRYIGDDNGQFREFGALADGKVSRLRSADGIHFSDEGASLLTSELINWLTPTPVAISGKTPPQ